MPQDARTRPCDAPDVCALCNADGSLFTFASGCAPTPARCDDTNPCPLGTSTWTGRGGACLPSEPCAGDTACHALGRACVTTLGVASCGRCLDDLVDRDAACVATSVDYVGPYRVGRDHFSIWDGSRYRHLFLRGVNVGGPRPGESADQTSLTEDDWLRWIAIWAEAGMNLVHVYRLHDPPLYRALLAWNGSHVDQPIYLLQGVYGVEPPTPATDLFASGTALDDEVAHAIDCVHGACTGYPDASPWTIAWLLGRELDPQEVLTTDAAHQSIDAYEGDALSIRATTPSAAWVVERMDRAVVLERSRYGTERPIAHILWSALDPITHRTERASRSSDLASIDLAGVDASRAPAGHFVSYHAYPYDPGFLSDDVDYLWCADQLGPNSYRGYLGDLRAHHRDQAMLVAEFGVPTSLAPGHAAPSGMSQGGIDEREQGASAARMLENIRDVGAAGGVWFQWEDRWWKNAWTTAGRAFPAARFPLWHDRLNPEQAFGLLAFEPTPSAEATLFTSDAGRVRAVRASSSATVLHVEVELDAPLAGDALEVGLDVLDRARGESALPSGTPLIASAAELAVTVQAGAAQARITPCLDPSRALDDPSFVASTRAGGCGGWASLRWTLGEAYVRPSDECYVPRQLYDLGTLHVRDASAAAGSLDVVVIDASTVRFDIPWNVLMITDPSTRSVLDDRASTAETEASITDGIALAIAVDGVLIETRPYTWPTWEDAPATTERLKDGAETFFAYMRSLPRWLD